MQHLILNTAGILAVTGCEGAVFAKQPAVSLADAVITAQEHTGGTAIDADLDDDERPAFYEVTVILEGAAPTVVWIDAEAGSVASTWTDDSDAEDVGLLAKADLTLLDAIDAAEDFKGGYATSADLDDAGPAPHFDVEVVKELRTIDLQVDAATGAVTKERED